MCSRCHSSGPLVVGCIGLRRGHPVVPVLCCCYCCCCTLPTRHRGALTQQVGMCRYVWAQGNVYDGEWRAGKMHGQGTLRWRSGEPGAGQLLRAGKVRGAAGTPLLLSAGRCCGQCSTCCARLLHATLVYPRTPVAHAVSAAAPRRAV